MFSAKVGKTNNCPEQLLLKYFGELFTEDDIDL